MGIDWICMALTVDGRTIRDGINVLTRFLKSIGSGGQLKCLLRKRTVVMLRAES